jgi:EF hand
MRREGASGVAINRTKTNEGIKEKMKPITKTFWLAMLVLLLVACHSGGTYHQSAMPDPAAYNAHFGDMDANQDGQVSQAEFKAHFPQADMKVFEIIDADQDNSLSHEEWHRFKEAHGLKHH